TCRITTIDRQRGPIATISQTLICRNADFWHLTAASGVDSGRLASGMWPHVCSAFHGAVSSAACFRLRSRSAEPQSSVAKGDDVSALAEDVRELVAEQVQFRELLYRMTLRDLLIRYKQTLMGFGWAIFAPVVNTIVFSVIFTRVATIQTNIPYP